jgi:hypothetical protein
MRLLRDDFLVVENQFGDLNTQSQIVGYLNDPEHTPYRVVNTAPIMLLGGILSVFGIPFLIAAALQIARGQE